jgi:hypothetical protein
MNVRWGRLVAFSFIVTTSAAYAEDPDAVADRFIKQKGGSHCKRTGGGSGTSGGRFERHAAYECYIRNDRFMLQLNSVGARPQDSETAIRWVPGYFEKITN